jgi:hypothetical protein
MSAIHLYDSVAVVPAAELAGLPPTRWEARQRRLAGMITGGIAGLIALAVVAGAFVLYLRDGASWPLWPLLLAVSWFGGIAALIAWLSLRHIVNASGPDGWVLREDGTHLLVNLRSHLNTHFDPTTPSVLVLPKSRVRSLQVLRERGVRTHVGDYGVVFENPIRREFLDIAFAGDAAAVAAALAAEATRRSAGGSRFHHSAVRMLPDGTLRIAWRDETNRLRPSLDACRRQLSPRYRFAAAASGEQKPLEELDATAKESRLLEMLARGERMEAVALAKVLYGMSTTEAVDFIDTLRR